LEGKYTIEKYFAQGSFPRSLLAYDAKASYESTFMVEVVPSYISNLGKRLVKVELQT